MKSLDEAIRHCEEVAEQNKVQADKWQDEGGAEWGKTITCRECAADHRQYVSECPINYPWLKEE